jgi:hypothetical protein
MVPVVDADLMRLTPAIGRIGTISFAFPLSMIPNLLPGRLPTDDPDEFDAPDAVRCGGPMPSLPTAFVVGAVRDVLLIDAAICRDISCDLALLASGASARLDEAKRVFSTVACVAALMVDDLRVRLPWTPAGAALGARVGVLVLVLALMLLRDGALERGDDSGES